MNRNACSGTHYGQYLERELGWIGELASPGRFEVREVEPRPPGPEEVQVSVHACGICGSDVERFAGIGGQKYPLVLGHEISGVVAAVGPGVDRVRAGDAVVVVPVIPCFRCNYCDSGSFSHCVQYSFIGSRRAGGFASVVTIPSQNALLIPDRVEIETGALVEPISIGSHALRRAGLRPSDSVATIGAGNIGLCTGLVARVLGNTQVRLLDILNDRVRRAQELRFAADIVSDVGLESLADVVIEATRSPRAIRDAIRMAKPTGRIVCIGKVSTKLSFSVEMWDALLRKELSLAGAWLSYSSPFPGEDWTLAMGVVADQQTALQRLVTHRIGLKDLQICFESLRKNPGKFGRVFVCP